MTTLEKWKKYWEKHNSPLHRYSTKEYYQQYAAELKILFNNRKTPNIILEIGCGNGDLYEYLDFNKAKQYKGVDFSSTMLDDFRKKYQNLDLECCDGSTYCDHNKYDLIFSNSVIHFFNYEMLNQHFSNVKTMMNENSYFICASVPWRAQKFRFINGELGRNNNTDLVKGSINYLKSIIRDPMGIWYDLSTIKHLALYHNMSIEFYASMHYMYRFHAVMKLK